MSATDNSAANSDDIQRVYADRDATKGDRYAFYQPDNRLQMAIIERHLSRFLLQAFDGNLRDNTSSMWAVAMAASYAALRNGGPIPQT